MSFPVLIRWWSKQGRRAAASRRRRRAEAGAETLPRRGPARPQRGRSRRGGRQPGPRRLRRAARRAARAARAPRLPQHSREGESAPVANVAIENGFGKRSAVCQRARGPPVQGLRAASGVAGGRGSHRGQCGGPGRRGRGPGGRLAPAPRWVNPRQVAAAAAGAAAAAAAAAVGFGGRPSASFLPASS